MDKYHFKLEVTGSGRFQMYPADPGTVRKIEDSFDRTTRTFNTTYTVCADFTNFIAVNHAIERFASFGFTAIIVDEYKAA